MLVHHAHARLNRGPRIAGRQNPSEGFDGPAVGNIMAKQDIHERRLAGAVFTQKRNHLAALEAKADTIIGKLIAEPLGDVVKAQDRRRVLAPGAFHQPALGSLSSIATVKAPDRMAASFSATSALTASGTLSSKVPSGETEQPSSFMKE